jgi:hypothetical protein
LRRLGHADLRDKKWIRSFRLSRAWILSIGFAALALSASTVARASGTSLTGTLADPESTFDYTLNLASTSTITLQTYGFGGGTNQAGQAISAGGTDDFLAIFAGTGDGATILTDGFGNPYGTSLDISNYGSFVGCPPANTVSDFGSTTCGDITMTIPNLAAGTYTIVLSDGDYFANAVFDNGTLGEGFTDLTGGTFCNLQDSTGVDCPNISGAYALDITGLPAAVTPEPPSLLLFGTGFFVMGWAIRKWKGLARGEEA